MIEKVVKYKVGSYEFNSKEEAEKYEKLSKTNSNRFNKGDYVWFYNNVTERLERRSITDSYYSYSGEIRYIIDEMHNTIADNDVYESIESYIQMLKLKAKDFSKN